MEGCLILQQIFLTSKGTFTRCDLSGRLVVNDKSYRVNSRPISFQALVGISKFQLEKSF